MKITPDQLISMSESELQCLLMNIDSIEIGEGYEDNIRFTG